jgi:peptide alpha-N-acetyltransferase
MIYHIRVLEDMGEFREALTRLDANAKDRVIVDRVAIMETRGEFSINQLFVHNDN